MARVKEVTPKVMQILTDCPETRDDDKMLILTVYRKYYRVMPHDPIGIVLARNDLPSFESIRRARQKLQAEIPELRASDKVDAMRTVEQEEYREYAKEPLGV